MHSTGNGLYARLPAGRITFGDSLDERIPAGFSRRNHPRIMKTMATSPGALFADVPAKPAWE
jgi:hypothetical protein